MPWCRTSHGASPRLAPIISAMPTLHRTRPTTSRGRRWSVVRAGALVKSVIPRGVSSALTGSGRHARRDLVRIPDGPRPTVRRCGGYISVAHPGERQERLALVACEHAVVSGVDPVSDVDARTAVDVGEPRAVWRERRLRSVRDRPRATISGREELDLAAAALRRV